MYILFNIYVLLLCRVVEQLLENEMREREREKKKKQVRPNFASKLFFSLPITGFLN